MRFLECITTAVFLCSSYSGYANQTSNYAIKSFSNANIVDVNNGAIIENSFLVLNGDTIEYVGQTLPKRYLHLDTLDAQGQYVMPGLIDTHAHISLGEVTLKETRGRLAINANSSDELSKWNAKELLRWGVTFIRNPGGSSIHNLKYKQELAAGNIIGPKALIAGEIINRGEFDGLTIDINKNMSLQTAIGQQKDAGIDIIKLYAGLSDQQVKEAIKIGHKFDMKVIGHLEEVSWTDAANWQIDGLVHAMPISSNLLPKEAKEQYEKHSRPGAFAHFEWYESADLNSKPMLELYQALRENKVHVDPTLIAFKNSFYGDSQHVIGHPNLNHVHPELLNNWKTFFTFNIGWKPEDFSRARKVWPKVLSFVNRLYKEGVPLTIGTDLGNPWVIPGFSVHQEMQLFADAGIPNNDILRMATINAAKQLNIAEHHGSIEQGKVSNILFLKNNPLENIANTKTITKVFLAGNLVNEQLDQ